MARVGPEACITTPHSAPRNRLDVMGMSPSGANIARTAAGEQEWKCIPPELTTAPTDDPRHCQQHRPPHHPAGTRRAPRSLRIDRNHRPASPQTPPGSPVDTRPQTIAAACPRRTGNDGGATHAASGMTPGCGQSGQRRKLDRPATPFAHRDNAGTAGRDRTPKEFASDDVTGQKHLVAALDDRQMGRCQHAHGGLDGRRS